MKRIAIVGCSGSGKSTLARQLGEMTGLEVIHLDRLYWKPGWVESSKEEICGKVVESVKGGSWIIDGNYGSVMEINLAAADTIIFLDFPTWLNLWRVTKRRFQYRIRQRPDMTEGCPEKIHLEFYQWIWSYPRRHKPVTLRRIEQHGQGKRVFILRNPREVARFLDQVRKESGRER